MSSDAFRALDMRSGVDDSSLLGGSQSQSLDSADTAATTSAKSQPLLFLSRRQAMLLVLISGLIALAAVVLSAVSVTLVLTRTAGTSPPSPTPAANVSTRSAADLEACIAQQSTFKSTRDAAARTPDNTTGAILIKNALIHDGFKPAFQGDILLEGGLIKQVARSIARPSATTRVYDVQGRHVTPGIVDAHSHVGVSAFPTDYVATSDTNEGTNPIFPQVRALDAVDVQDPAIALVRSGGVTTVQILPGSGNAMGGEGVLMKLKNSTYVDDFLIPGAPHLLKMACGENPKRSYGRAKGVTPMTRMGAAWIMRSALEQATSLVNQQRAWCALDQPTTPFPDSLASQALTALLRNTARLHTHCYTPTDFAMMMRLTDEFNFTIAAFHHAMGAHTIPATIKARNITVATFADQWGHKWEQQDSSVYQGQRLEQAGIPIALKSDHPVFNSEYLVFEGVKSHAWGLSYDGTIAALTSTPAQAIGLANRLGAIRVGLDADVVVWDIDPLSVGARPLKVIIDGKIHVDGDTDAPPELADPAPGAPLSCAEGSAQQTLSCYAVVDALVYLMTPQSDNREPQAGQTVVVVDGQVQCVGTSCTVPAGCTRYSPQSGVIIPGFIEAGSHIGQLEYVQERTSQDGTNDGPSLDGSYSVVSALDGLHVYGRHLDASRRGGVTVAINPPMVGSQLVVGLSTAVLTRTTTDSGATPLFAEHNLVQHRVALHLQLGNSAKSSGLSNSLSGQFAALRALFERAARAPNATSETDSLWAFQQVLQRALPLSVEVDAADQISSLLRLQRHYGFKLIVQGGAEAHLLADELAATSPPTAVVFTSRPVPSTFQIRRLRYDAFSALKAAKVPVGLQYADPNLSMNLRWELAFQRRFNRLSTYDVLETATSSIVNIFNLGPTTRPLQNATGRITHWSDGLGSIQVGAPANFLLFNGDPLSAATRLQLLAVGADVECRPVLF